MDGILKKPYKISLWEDEQWYVLVNNGRRFVSTDISEGTVVNDYFKEVKIADIGGSDIHTPISTHNERFVQKINGTNELTFTIFFKYYDEETFEWKENPWLDLLVNERKIKLEYDGEFYDFIIKQIDKNQAQYTYTYTCTDRYIDELSKNGYELEFSIDSLNGSGTLEQLGERVLAGSDWQLGVVDKVQNTANEILYTYSVTSTLTGRVLSSGSYGLEEWTEGDTITIPSGETIYVFYSSVVNNEVEPQFMYKAAAPYVVDEDGTILNSPNYIITNGTFSFHNLGVSRYRGDKLSAQQQAIYIPNIDRYCTIYTKNNVDYYCYQDNFYTSCDAIQQLITNNTNFASTVGWVCENGSIGYEPVEGHPDETVLKLVGTLPTAPVTIKNSGIFDNRALFKNGLITGTKYEFLIAGNNISNLTPQIVLQKEGEGGDPSTAITKTITFSYVNSTIIHNKTYYRYEGTVTANEACSKEELLEYIVLDFELTIPTNNFTISDTLLFEYLTDGAGNLILPDPSLVFTEVIKTAYYMFPVSGVTPTTTVDQINYSDKIISDSETPVNYGYQPKLTNDYTKMRSISAEKSNRFNILQSLCETFECWAKFRIEHDENGATVYNYEPVATDAVFIPGKRYYTLGMRSAGESVDISYNIVPTSTTAPSDWPTGYYVKNYSKFVDFKKYIGKDNDAGFRYGINLKSIQRKDDSQNIVTKLIVEPNLLTDGTCTIQGASLNTLGEKWIYNFDYYVQHGIIDNSVLLRDLYNNSDTNGLGFAVKVSSLNSEILAQNRLMTILGSTQAKQYAYYQAALQAEVAAESEMNKYAGYLTREGITPTGGYYTESTNYNTLINEYIRKHNNQKKTYLSKHQEAIDWYSQYTTTNTKYTSADETMKALEKQKEAITKDFYQKYSIYIKEGTWQSEDYIDDNLYYIDALSVSATSAKPQVTYNINVLELSQLEGYENYSFAIGDKTYVEDVELFGYNQQGTPYKEEIIVSELSYSLNDPSQNNIKVQNYKTQFDDLFQRVAAETQSLQYNKGSYARAAAAVDENGALSSALLDKSLSENAAVISNAYDQSVTWDDTGITIKSIASGHGNEIVRLVSGGIVLSNDGGASWHTGITAEGINADVINTGTLNTNLINIYNTTGRPTFIWDNTGLNAYAIDGNIVSESKYVRFDSTGIRGIQNNNVAVPVFALTYDGFQLNAINSSNYVKINADGPTETVTYWDPQGQTLKKIIYAGQNGVDKFKVYEDGSIYASNGYFTGHVEATSGYFTGELRANAIKVLDNNVWTNILEGNKIKNNYLDLGNIQIDGNNTTITLGSGGEILLGNPNGKYISITDSSINIVGYSSYTDSDVANYLNTAYSITSTSLNSARIESPTIAGNNVIATTCFTVDDGTTHSYTNSTGSGTANIWGHMGKANGESDGITTYGIAIASSQVTYQNGKIVTTTTDAPYIIVTDYGVRMNYDSDTYFALSSAEARLQFNSNNYITFDATDGIIVYQNGTPVTMGTAVFG